MNLRIAAAALLIIVVAPMIVAMAWPEDTETEDIFTVEQGLDITPALATADIPVIDTYTGPNNNRWLYTLDGSYVYSPVSLTTTPSALPNTSRTQTSETITAMKTIDLQSFQGYRWDIQVGANYIAVSPSGEPGDAEDYLRISYYPATGTIYGYTVGSVDTITVTPSTVVSVYASQVSPTLVFYTEHQLDGRYVDLSKGFLLNRPSGWAEWGNGMKNHSVTWWASSASVDDLQFRINGTTTVLTVDAQGGRITANGEPLGSSQAYPYIQIRIGEDAIEVAGVMGADGFTASSYTLGSSLTFAGVQPYQVIEMGGAAIYEVRVAQAEIGTSKGILNARITPYDYYPSYAWQVSISNVAVYGRSIEIGAFTYDVIDGVMCHPDGTPIAEVNGMAILSLVEDGYQNIYVNGRPLTSVITPVANYHITLYGSWYADVYVSSVEQGTQTKYVWNIPNWGLDTQGYCMVGMIAAITTTIGAGLWGRRNGTHAFAVVAVGLLSAGAYYIMM